MDFTNMMRASRAMNAPRKTATRTERDKVIAELEEMERSQMDIHEAIDTLKKQEKSVLYTDDEMPEEVDPDLQGDEDWLEQRGAFDGR